MFYIRSHSGDVSTGLPTYEHHQAGPLMGPLLVARDLFVGQVVRVSRLGPLARRALAVLPTQTEAPPEASWAAGGGREQEQRSGSPPDTDCSH